MKKWMNRLAEQQREKRRAYPTDRLIVVFDIDDTILDLRHMILHVLRSFDERHETTYFRDLAFHDVSVDETRIREMTNGLCLSAGQSRSVLAWFKQHSWSTPVVRNAHRPFPGVMEVIRWLQAQPGTFVGLNTGRPEIIRRDTLACLNRIGLPHGVTFEDRLLYMSPYPWGERIVESKVEGIAHFQESGYRVIAFVDNEPENLKAVSDSDRTGEILLLHADTVFAGERKKVPEHAVSGNIYDVTELAGQSHKRDPFERAA